MVISHIGLASHELPPLVDPVHQVWICIFGQNLRRIPMTDQFRTVPKRLGQPLGRQ